MFTVNVAVEFGATVTAGALKLAASAAAKYPNANGYTLAGFDEGPVPILLTCERWWVIAVAAVFVTVSCWEPPFPSPSENLNGATDAGVCTAGTIWASPAPWRHVGSRPATGAMFSPFGSAVFISSAWTRAGEMFLFFAWSTSAARPAMCGAAIDVPLMLL